MKVSARIWKTPSHAWRNRPLTTSAIGNRRPLCEVHNERLAHDMKRRHFLPLLVAPVFPRGATGAPDNSFEWPQWRGPDRTGVSRETGLLPSWPASGPPALWSISNLGEGYGSLAIRGDRIYVQGVLGRDSVVFCLNRRDGKTSWTTVLAGKMEQDRGSGPRGTPTLDADRLYVLAENGELACLRA